MPDSLDLVARVNTSIADLKENFEKIVPFLDPDSQGREEEVVRDVRDYTQKAKDVLDRIPQAQKQCEQMFWPEMESVLSDSRERIEENLNRAEDWLARLG